VQRLPDHAAQRLPSAATLRVVAELREGAAGDTETDGGALLLWTGTPPRTHVAHRTLSCGTSRLDRSATVFAIWPHVGAGSIAVTARTPDGLVLPLVVVRQFDPRYQPTYRFRRPIALPGGTAIDVRGAPGDCEVDLATVSDSPER
jgi:hypothetical protein